MEEGELLGIPGFTAQTIAFGSPNFEVVKYLFFWDRLLKMLVKIEAWLSLWLGVAAWTPAGRASAAGHDSSSTTGRRVHTGRHGTESVPAKTCKSSSSYGGIT